MSSTPVISVTLLTRWNTAVGVVVREISLEFVLTTLTLRTLINTDLTTEIIVVTGRSFTTVFGSHYSEQ